MEKKKRPSWFTRKKYLSYKKKGMTDKEIREEILKVGRTAFFRYKKELNVKGKRARLTNLSLPESFTKEKYLSYKKQGMTDKKICEKVLFISLSTFKKFKKELGIVGVKVTRYQMKEGEMQNDN